MGSQIAGYLTFYLYSTLASRFIPSGITWVIGPGVFNVGAEGAWGITACPSLENGPSVAEILLVTA